MNRNPIAATLLALCAGPGARRIGGRGLGGGVYLLEIRDRAWKRAADLISIF